MFNAIVIDEGDAGTQAGVRRIDEGALSPGDERADIERMTTTIGLAQAIPAAADLLDGKRRGRVVVDVKR